MNIGIFTDTYHPQINGVVTSIRTLETQLTKRGHKVFIFTTTNPSKYTDSYRVFRLPSIPVMFLPNQRMVYLYSPKLILKFKKFKLDIIHTHTEFPVGIFGKIVTDFLKIPHVHTYHTMYEDYVHYIAKGYLITPSVPKILSRIFCNRATAVIVPAEKTRQTLLNYGVTKPINVIPTGIDFEPFNPNNFNDLQLLSLKEEFNINKSDKVLLFVGRLGKEKSIDVIINAMPQLIKKIPSVKLLIVGDGPYRGYLEKLTASLNINDNVIFAGFRKHKTIGKYYKLADVFVTASTSETQGLTYFECMASKTPIVVKYDKSIEGIVIDGETGFIFNNNEDASNIIYNAINSPNLKDITVKAFYNISHLSAKQFGKSVENLYLDTINNYSGKKYIFNTIANEYNKSINKFKIKK